MSKHDSCLIWWNFFKHAWIWNRKNGGQTLRFIPVTTRTDIATVIQYAIAYNTKKIQQGVHSWQLEQIFEQSSSLSNFWAAKTHRRTWMWGLARYTKKALNWASTVFSQNRDIPVQGIRELISDQTSKSIELHSLRGFKQPIHAGVGKNAHAHTHTHKHGVYASTNYAVFL